MTNINTAQNILNKPAFGCNQCEKVRTALKSSGCVDGAIDRFTNDAAPLAGKKTGGKFENHLTLAEKLWNLVKNNRVIVSDDIKKYYSDEEDKFTMKARAESLARLKKTDK